MMSSALARFFGLSKPRNPALMLSASNSMYAASTGMMMTVASTETVDITTVSVLPAVSSALVCRNAPIGAGFVAMYARASGVIHLTERLLGSERNFDILLMTA